MAECVTLQNLDLTMERKITTRSFGHSRRVNILRRGRGARRASSPAVTSTVKAKQKAAKQCETESKLETENSVNDHLDEPLAILTTLGLTKIGAEMHLNSTQEPMLSEDNKEVSIKDTTAKISNGVDENHAEKVEEEMEVAANNDDGIESLVECYIEQDNDKTETKVEDNCNTDNTDDSVLDCSVKNSPTADAKNKEFKIVEPKIKVKDNLLENRESQNIKLYENNLLVERMKLMEENNSMDGVGLNSDEDNLMIDINPADVQVMQDDKDDKESDTSQDSVELRLTNRKNKRKSGQAQRDQTDLNALAAKKFKRQVDQTFIRHDRIIKDYLQRTDKPSSNPKENLKYVMQHMEQIIGEIRNLSDLSRQKEQEWNELIHLQKAKEELLMRLSRRRDIMIMRMKADDAKSVINEQNSYTMLNTINRNYQNTTYNLTNMLSKITSSVSPVMTNGDGLNSVNKLDQQTQSLLNKNIHNGLVVLPVNNINNTNNMQPKPQMPPQAHSNNRIKNVPMNHYNNIDNLHHNQFLLNQQLNSPINGRQGMVKDVKSIIADYRQRHPEAVPKRGRRMKSILQTNNGGDVDTNRLSELGLLPANEMNSRPSSSESNDNLLLRNQNYQMSNGHGSPLTLMNDIARTNDVTLHPIASNNEDSGKQQSLLHGILSKKSSRSSTVPSDNSTAYSSTLARLLTAPERSSSNSLINHSSTLAERLTGNLNIRKVTKPITDSSKRRCVEEVTITPIDTPATEPSEIKKEMKEVEEQQLEVKAENCATEEDGADEEEENPPACQGCNKSEAHYVCAGCANQWYCSRECQVNAWEVHSEVCKG